MHMIYMYRYMQVLVCTILPIDKLHVCGIRTLISLTVRVDVVSVLIVFPEVSAVLPVGLVGGVKLGR